MPFCHVQRREKRILRFAQNDKGGAQNDGEGTQCSLPFTPSVRQSRTAPSSRGSYDGRANQGPHASPAKRVAWGEDEQGSGARNARQGVLSGADFARTTSRPTQRKTTPPPCHSEAVRPKNPLPSSSCLSVTYKDGRNGFFASLRMTRGALRMTERGRSAPSRSPPQSGRAGQLPRPGGAMMGAQIRGPTRAQRSGSRGGRTSKGAEREMPARAF